MVQSYQVARFYVPETANICKTVPQYSSEERHCVMDKIKDKLKRHRAVLVAHYYVHEDLQKLAEETGGFIGDSLEMAKFGKNSDAEMLVVAGVRFMGETAKILSPEKTVIMPTLEATCSLDVGCPIDRFDAFCQCHPERTVVVYANTSAVVKARADWVVTSSIAVEVICHLDDLGKRILWAPDKYLGHYIERVSGADILHWQGSCVVHEEFKHQELLEMKKQYPEAAILVHPESPAAVIDCADVVGSTSKLIKAAAELPNKYLIVATDNRIFYKMRQAAVGKVILEAPTAGEGATCKSCGHCPWMAMNGLHNLDSTLDTLDNEIVLDEEVRLKAWKSTNRMMEFRTAALSV